MSEHSGPVPIAVSSGRVVNKHGRLYKNGSAYSMDLKLEVADEYQQSSARCGGGRPNLSQIAAKFNVHWNFVKKIEDELRKYYRVLPPEEIRANQDRPVGPGSQSLCQFELFIIVRLL